MKQRQYLSHLPKSSEAGVVKSIGQRIGKVKLYDGGSSPWNGCEKVNVIVFVALDYQ